MLSIICNPIAGGVNGVHMSKCIEKVKEKLNSIGVKFKFYMTEFKKHAEQLVKKAIDEGATDVVVMGGDGTLNEVLNGFKDFDKVNLGLIPCGTGNDFATAANIPEDIDKAIDIIVNGTPKYTDYMQFASGIRGFNIVGEGMDVDILKRYEGLKKKSKVGYTKCLVYQLFHITPHDYKVTIDDKEYIFNKTVIADIANGTDYGGGIPICPVAKIDDGLLEFISIENIPLLKLIKVFLKLKKGKILEQDCTTRISGKKIKVECLDKVTVNVDGELYDDLDLDVEVVSGKLKMYR